MSFCGFMRLIYASSRAATPRSLLSKRIRHPGESRDRRTRRNAGMALAFTTPTLMFLGPGFRRDHYKQTPVLHPQMTTATARATHLGAPREAPFSHGATDDLGVQGRVENSGGIQASLAGGYATALF